VSTTKRDINEYLFWEFGFDLHADVVQVSEEWPFDLSSAGTLSLPDGRMDVLEFSHENESYFVLDGPHALSFVKAAGMTLEDVRIQEMGRT
jgi:hypothetical protein